MTEHEELAQVLEALGDDYDDLYRQPSAIIRPQLARAAVLLREARPRPVAAPTPDDFRRWWRETGSDDSGPTPEMLLTANAWASSWAARCAQPIPQPAPVADHPWERPEWCDAEGRCWWGRCADDFFSPEWTMATLANIEEFCSDAMPQHCLPHWAIPQPPQGGEVEP